MFLKKIAYSAILAFVFLPFPAFSATLFNDTSIATSSGTYSALTDNDDSWRYIINCKQNGIGSIDGIGLTTLSLGNVGNNALVLDGIYTTASSSNSYTISSSTTTNMWFTWSPAVNCNNGYVVLRPVTNGNSINLLWWSYDMSGVPSARYTDFLKGSYILCVAGNSTETSCGAVANSTGADLKIIISGEVATSGESVSAGGMNDTDGFRLLSASFLVFGNLIFLYIGIWGAYTTVKILIHGN